jgi:hypothetical protein
MKNIEMESGDIEIYSPHFVNLINQFLIKIIPKKNRSIWCYFEGTAAYNIAKHNVSYLNKFKRKVLGLLKFGISSISKDYMYGHFDDIYGFVAPEPNNIYHQSQIKVCFELKTNYLYKELTNKILILGTYSPNNSFLSDLINTSMVDCASSLDENFHKYFKGHPNYDYKISNFSGIESIEDISAEDCLYSLSPKVTIAGFGSFLINAKNFFNENNYLVLFFQSDNQIDLFKRLGMKCDRSFLYKKGGFIEIYLNERPTNINA